MTTSYDFDSNVRVLKPCRFNRDLMTVATCLSSGNPGVYSPGTPAVGAEMCKQMSRAAADVQNRRFRHATFTTLTAAVFGTKNRSAGLGSNVSEPEVGGLLIGF